MVCNVRSLSILKDSFISLITVSCFMMNGLKLILLRTLRSFLSSFNLLASWSFTSWRIACQEQTHFVVSISLLVLMWPSSYQASRLLSQLMITMPYGWHLDIVNVLVIVVVDDDVIESDDVVDKQITWPVSYSLFVCVSHAEFYLILINLSASMSLWDEPAICLTILRSSRLRQTITRPPSGVLYVKCQW